MRPVSCISPLVLLLALAGCHTEVHGGHNDAGMSLDGDTITLHRTGGPSAHVTRDGRFTVGDAPVTLSAQQQAEFVTLYNTAQQIKQHGIQTGKAGAELLEERRETPHIHFAINALEGARQIETVFESIAAPGRRLRSVA